MNLVRSPFARGLVTACFGALAVGPVQAETAAEGRPETVPLRHLDVEDGLSHSVVYALLRDRDGFVWIGTEDGLDRYDGERFEHIHHLGAEQGGTHWDTSDLVQDADGVLWIATWGGGLKRIDPATGEVTVFRHDPADATSLVDDRLQRLHLDDEGRLWIGTYEGLDRLDQPEDGSVRFVHYPRRPGLSQRVWAISSAADGRLWVGTDEGLDLLDPAAESGAWRIATYLHVPGGPSGLSHPLTRELLPEANGRLWVGTEGGLDLLEPGTEVFRRVDALSDESVNVLRRSPDGDIWVGTQDHGLVRLDPETLEVREHLAFDPAARADGDDAGSLRHADVRALMEDSQSLLWVGTRGGGVEIFDRGPRAVRRVDLGVRADELANPRELLVTAVLVETPPAGGSTLWVGTERGLVRIDTGVDGERRVRRYRHDPADLASLRDDSIQVLHRGQDGGLWIGTWRGLDRFDARTGRFEHFPLRARHAAAGDPLPERIESLADAADGDLWVGTRAGLARLDIASGESRFWFHDPADDSTLGDDFVRALAFDADGALWIGTDAAGLERFDPQTGEFRHHRYDAADPASLGHDRIFDIWRHPSDGSLWLATAFGVDRFDPRAGTAIRLGAGPLSAAGGLGAGLPSQTAKCLVGDAEGRTLWISSNGGVTRLPLDASGLPAALDADADGRSLRNFGRSDGLGGLLFVAGSCAADPSGDGFYFGGRHGLDRVDAAPPAEVAVEIPLVLTGVTVSGRSRPSNLEALDLDWDHRSFGFEFAALDYRAPERVRYAHRLEGFDDVWTESGRRYVAYTNVAPGDYVFRVRATDSRGRPVPGSLSIPVRVTPPYWQAHWFRIGTLLLLVALLTAGYKLRTRHLKQQRQILEQQVRRQTRTLRRQRRRLEMIDQIVQLINEESDFEQVLASILEGISFAQAADRALALVRLRSDDTPRDSFEIGADFGWPGGIPSLAPLDRWEVEERYLAAARELADGIWLGAPSPSALRAAETALDRAPRRVLALRVELDSEPAGYLLFSKLSDDEAFSQVDVGELVNLKHHVESAFRKAALLDQMRWLNAKKSEFLGFAAHDLRSPLGSIQSYADLLLRWLDQKRFDEARWKRFLGHVRSAAAHMLALLNDLLDVTAIETGRLVLAREPMELAALLDERHQLQERVALDKDIRWTADLQAARGVEVVADRVHTAEVVDNLLSNALKFTEPGGSVRLACEVDAARLRVTVTDTGQGLGPEEVDDVFGGRKLSARPTGGETSTGLGLVIVKKIVEMQGGEVWVESEQGRGSTFGFSLPRAAVAEPPEASEDGETDSATRATAMVHNGTQP